MASLNVSRLRCLSITGGYDSPDVNCCQLDVGLVMFQERAVVEPFVFFIELLPDQEALRFRAGLRNTIQHGPPTDAENTLDLEHAINQR